MLQRGFCYNGRWYPYIAGGAEGDDDGKPDDDNKDDNKEGSDDKGGDDRGTGDKDRAISSANARNRQLQKKLDEYERKDQEATEKAAKEKGEYERLYTEGKAKSDQEIAVLRAELFHRDAERSLLSYLSDKHPSHMGRLRWILPVLSTELSNDMDAEAVAVAVKKVADDYVKDHPINSDSSGAPNGTGGKGGGKPPANPLEKFPGIKEFADQHLSPNVAGAGGR